MSQIKKDADLILGFPNPGTWTVIGAAGPLEALADKTNNSYLVINAWDSSFDESFGFEVEDYTLPDLARLTALNVELNLSYGGDNTPGYSTVLAKLYPEAPYQPASFSWYFDVSDTDPEQTYTGGMGNWTTIANFQDKKMYFLLGTVGDVLNIQWATVVIDYAQVAKVDNLTVDASGQGSWIFTDPENGYQQAFESIAVLVGTLDAAGLVAGDPEFDPSTAANSETAGVTYSAATTTNFVAFPQVSLPVGDYICYVRVASPFAADPAPFWGEWASATAKITDVGPVPRVTTVVDPDDGRIVVRVDARPNMLEPDLADTSFDLGAPVTNRLTYIYQANGSNPMVGSAQWDLQGEAGNNAYSLEIPYPQIVGPVGSAWTAQVMVNLAVDDLNGNGQDVRCRVELFTENGASQFFDGNYVSLVENGEYTSVECPFVTPGLPGSDAEDLWQARIIFESSIAMFPDVDFVIGGVGWYDGIEPVGSWSTGEGADPDDSRVFVQALKLPSTDNSFFSTPDSSAISVGGSFVVEAMVRADALPTINSLIGSKWGGDGNEWLLEWLGSGRLALALTSDGSTLIWHESSIPIPVTAGEWVGVRATFWQSSGAVGFDTSVDGITWTPLGDTSDGAGGHPIFDSDSPMRIGHTTWDQFLTGLSVRWFRLTQTDGTLRASFAADDAPSTAGSWIASGTGETWSWTGADPQPLPVGDQIDYDNWWDDGLQLENGPAGKQIIELQRNDAGTWATMAGTPTAQSPAGSMIFYDRFTAHGEAVQHRARATTGDGDPTTESPWSIPVGTQSDIRKAWICDPDDLTGLTDIVVILIAYEDGVDQNIETHRPVGSTFPVVLTSAEGGMSGSFTVEVGGRAEKVAAESLIGSSKTLLLRTPHGDKTYLRVTRRPRWRWKPRRNEETGTELPAQAAVAVVRWAEVSEPVVAAQ